MAMVNILAWSLIGGITGWLVSQVARSGGMSVIGDIVVGLLGALITGFVLSLLLPDTFVFTSFNGESLIITFLGAFITLLIIRLFLGARAPS